MPDHAASMPPDHAADDIHAVAPRSSTAVGTRFTALVLFCRSVSQWLQVDVERMVLTNERSGASLEAAAVHRRLRTARRTRRMRTCPPRT